MMLDQLVVVGVESCFRGVSKRDWVLGRSWPGLSM